MLCASDIVRHLSFTGSTEVGRILAAQCAPTIKKLSLELGGNAPFIVFDDADLDSAVEGAMVSKYRNAGQTCVCANRLYVQDGVYDAFVAKLADKAARHQGRQRLRGRRQPGPADRRRRPSPRSRATSPTRWPRAPRVVAGGTTHRRALLHADRAGQRRPATCCARARRPSARWRRCSASRPRPRSIALANDTEFGLASYFYSRDIGRIFRVGEALEYGMVGINTGLISTAEVPFGGVKQSGLGREGSHHGIDDYVEIKYLCLGDILK